MGEEEEEDEEGDEEGDEEEDSERGTRGSSGRSVVGSVDSVGSVGVVALPSLPSMARLGFRYSNGSVGCASLVHRVDILLDMGCRTLHRARRHDANSEEGFNVALQGRAVVRHAVALGYVEILYLYGLVRQG
jgi:hypothetical protein